MGSQGMSKLIFYDFKWRFLWPLNSNSSVIHGTKNVRIVFVKYFVIYYILSVVLEE